MGFGGFCLKQAINFQGFQVGGVRYFSPRHPGRKIPNLEVKAVFWFRYVLGAPVIPSYRGSQEVAARMSKRERDISFPKNIKLPQNLSNEEPFFRRNKNWPTTVSEQKKTRMWNFYIWTTPPEFLGTKNIQKWWAILSTRWVIELYAQKKSL